MTIRFNRLCRAYILVVLLLVAKESIAQQRFATPQDAASALADAADSEDPAAFTTLFGSNFTQSVSSGDPQADRLGIQRLGTLMRQGFRVLPQGRHGFIEVGADKWRFPMRVTQTSAGDWAFNVEDGKNALLKRRVEKNEERALKIAEFYATAQKQYKTMTGHYASKFQSTPGKKDGLYWETGLDGIASPLEPLVARAQNLGYQKQGKEAPILTGYVFRVLTAQGEYAPGKTQSYLDANGLMTKGFGLLAYPSRYGVSGKMSFLVGAEGIVYQRDFGERTEASVTRIKQYDPDPSWHMIGGETVVKPKTQKFINTSDGIYPFYTEDY